MTKKLPSRQPEILSVGDVLKRIPLLKRVVRDIVECQDHVKKSREFLEELTIISRKFSSCEIEETINRLRREIAHADPTLEGFDKELRDLGGFLKDRNRGLIYFYSERGGRKVFLIWELRCPDLLFWHELDETFADRLPVDFPEGARASALDYPHRP